MLRYERDYMMRMIAAAAAAVARLRERLAGGASPGEIAAESRSAQGELLGSEAPLLRALDAPSAVHAIGDVDRIRAWVELLRLEAYATRSAGDPVAADALERRADALATAMKSPD